MRDALVLRRRWKRMFFLLDWYSWSFGKTASIVWALVVTQAGLVESDSGVRILWMVAPVRNHRPRN